MKNLTFFSLIFSATVLFHSCGQVATEVTEVIEPDSASATAKVKLDQILLNIPGPGEISAEMAKAGVNYNKGIMHSSSKSASYSTNFKMASNLGVYIADLSYATSYNQAQDALNCLNSIVPLAEKSGINNVYDAEMAKRFETSLSNKDSLDALINAAYSKANKSLRNNQRMAIAALVAAGGWVEGLYLATEMMKGVAPGEGRDELYLRVWNHVYSYKYLHELLTEFVDQADCAQMLKEMEEAGKIFVGYQKRPGVNQDDIAILNKQVSALRTSIIN